MVLIDEKLAARSGQDATTWKVLHKEELTIRTEGVHWWFGMKVDGIREAWMERRGSQLSNINFSTTDECNKSGLGPCSASHK